ncbi:MAG: DMT family transporter, partial [Chloroflexota bacterium]|nr:DMT family transporter [Chloroflexota bacterium]
MAGRTSNTGGVTPRQIGSMLALGTIWGSSYLFIKLLIDAADPVTIIALRMVLGAATLGLILLAQRRRLPAWGAVWGHLALMSLLGNLLPFWLIAWSQKYTTSALAAVLNAAIPLFTLLIAAIAFRMERITPNRVAGITLGISGVAFLTGRSVLDVQSSGGLGELALLAASLCYGFAFAYARRYVRGNPLANVTAQLGIGAIVITPVALLTGWIETDKLAATDIAGWIVLSAVGTGLAYVVYYSLIAEMGATAASFVTYIIPVVGVILGWIFLDERLAWTGFLGMALIVMGVWVSVGNRDV